MIEKFERRDAVRTDHISPIQVKDLKSGEIYEASMINYSYSGIYFESDGFFDKGTPIYIGIHNSPYSLASHVFDYYKGEVMWRKDLKRSPAKYGYGIELASDSGKQDIDFNDEKMATDSRKHPRKPFFRTMRFGTPRGIFKGTTKNISASGVFIATEEKLEIGRLIKLNLPLKAGKTKKIIGEVVWVTKGGLGLKFTKIK